MQEQRCCSERQGHEFQNNQFCDSTLKCSMCNLMASPITKMGRCTLQESKGSTSGLILARKSLEIEVNDSCPITSGLPSSSGPFLYRMENKTAYKSKDGVHPVHTELLKSVYDFHINFLFLSWRTSGNRLGTSARERKKKNFRFPSPKN